MKKTAPRGTVAAQKMMMDEEPAFPVRNSLTLLFEGGFPAVRQHSVCWVWGASVEHCRLPAYEVCVPAPENDPGSRVPRRGPRRPPECVTGPNGQVG